MAKLEVTMCDYGLQKQTRATRSTSFGKFTEPCNKKALGTCAVCQFDACEEHLSFALNISAFNTTPSTEALKRSPQDSTVPKYPTGEGSFGAKVCFECSALFADNRRIVNEHLDKALADAIESLKALRSQRILEKP